MERAVQSPDYKNIFSAVIDTYSNNTILRNFAEVSTTFYQLNGTVSRDFRQFFAQLHGPIWTGKNSFTNFFVFAKLFDYKAQHSLCPRCQRLCGHGILALGKARKRSDIFLRCPFNMYFSTTKKYGYKWEIAIVWVLNQIYSKVSFLQSLFRTSPKLQIVGVPE